MAAFIDLSSQLGISLWLFIVLTAWEAVWTGLAMWRAAKLKNVFWFIFFFVFNLLGIPEIIYLYVTKKKRR